MFDKLLNQSIRISQWAHDNAWKSRIIITLIHISLVVLGISIGQLAKQLEIILGIECLWIGIALLMVLFLGYPTRKPKARSQKVHAYVHRKVNDFAIALISLLLLILLSNRSDYAGNKTGRFFQVNELGAAILGPSPIDDTPSTGVSVYKSKDSKDRTKAEKIIYTLLALAGAIVLIILLALFTCELACSGATAAAILVSVLGIGGVLLLFFFFMKRLHNKKRKDQ